MKSICGADCGSCDLFKNAACKGCESSGCCPFGKKCFISEYIKNGGMESYNAFKKQLINEFNELHIDGMPEITELYPLNGAFVNMAYPMPSGSKLKLLDDNEIYLGTQAECLYNDGSAARCFGLAAGMGFLLVCEYGENGSDPQLIEYRRR